MNKMFKIAFGAVLSVGLVLPAIAQDNFPDVAENHWAYEAVGRLKEAEILFGYPDGAYRGNRPMSRYEFAAATYQFWKKVRGWYDNHEARIKALEGGGDGGDINELRDMVKQLRADVDMMKGWGKRIEDLEKLSAEFEKEMAAMGVDVKQLRSDLGDLEERVSKLEKVKPAVDIHGTVDFLALAGHSTDGNMGMTPSNRVFGLSDAGFRAGLTNDLTMYHEAAIDLKGTNEEGPKWQATVVVGNMIGDLGGLKANLGSYNNANFGSGFTAGSADIYIDNATVTFDTALVGQGFNATVGRMDHMVGQYLWKRSDFTTYFHNARWDDHKHTFDGAMLDFNFGPAALKVFGGLNSEIQSVNGTELNPIAGTGIDKTLGAQLMFPVGDMGGINLAYLWHRGDTPFGLIDGVDVYGGEVDLKFQNINVYGAYSKSDTKLGDNNVTNTDNTVWDIHLGYSADNWGVGGGYKEVERNFVAAGSWQRIGNQWSPTNIKGFDAKLWFKPSEDFKIWGKGQRLEPISTGGPFPFAGYDDITSIMVGLDYQFGPNWGTMLSYEDVRFNSLGGAADPSQKWFTIGFNYGMGANSSLMFTYQFSDLDFKGLAGAGLDPGGRNRYKGGLLGTQLSVKF